MTTESDPGFAALAQRIAVRSGLDVSAYKERCLHRRIAVRLRACGLHTYAEYLELIDRRPEEFEKLLDALTINVTKFFRNPETWEWLGREVLPDLMRDREGRLRLWSAGCASGEEPYTLAMLSAMVLERMHRADWLDRVHVDATDIDRRSIERTLAARYHVRAFSEAPAGVMQRFCVQVDADHVEVKPEIRRLVEVRRFDLIRERPERAYDVIVCRNVIIYFDRGAQEQLLESFAEALTPRGILVLGKVETLVGPAKDGLTMLETRERIYRKVA